MIHVLQVRSSLDEVGPGTQPLTIANELRRRGIKVSFASSGGRYVPEIIKAGFQVHLIPTLAFDRRDPVSTAKNIFQLGKIIWREDISVIHGHNSAATMCAYLGGITRGQILKVVNSVRGVELRPNYQWRNQILRVLPGKLLAVCETGREQLLSFGVPNSRILVSYNGVDLQRFNPQNHDGRKIREEFNLQGKIIAGVVGVVTGSKGQHVLVRALDILRLVHLDLHLLIVGDGIELENLKRIVAELGLQERVTLAGRRFDIPDCLAAMDIYCLPSVRGEFFPNSIVEAMAMERPWIGSRIAGLHELTAGDQAGWVSPVGDVVALAANLDRLASNAELRTKMGKCGRQEVEARFSIEKVVDRILDAYGLPNYVSEEGGDARVGNYR